MAKLYFKYGTMGCGKSLEIIRCAYNYIEKGKSVLLLTSSLDNRYGSNTKIISRIGLEMDAIPIYDESDIIQIFNDESNIDCVFVDEVQFMNPKHIDQLSKIVDYYNVPVICYGLISDYQNNPFKGSSYLTAIADKIDEIKSICWCGKKATTNARILDGEIVRNGEQILIGGNNSYVSLCRKHFKEGKLNK